MFAKIKALFSKKTRLIKKYRPVLYYKNRKISIKIPYTKELITSKYRIFIYSIDLTILGGEREIQPDPIKIFLDLYTHQLKKVCTRYHWNFLGKKCADFSELEMAGTHPIVYIPDNIFEKFFHGLLPKRHKKRNNIKF